LAGSQPFSFLWTKDHFSSSWSLVVRGGKAGQLAVGRPGVLARLAAQPRDGVAVDADESLGLADAAAVLEVGQGGAGHRLVEAAGEQRGPLALGEAGLAGLAVEQAAAVRAVAGADGDVGAAALAVFDAVAVEAAEAGEVFHGGVRKAGDG
jgi:hypothetical protein